MCTAIPGSQEGPTSASFDARLDAAERALSAARAYEQQHEYNLARLELGVLEWTLPEIKDRFALERAELLLKEGMPEEACRAFALALKSPETTIVAKSRVGEVRCLLLGKDKHAALALDKLLKHYPNLPEALYLKFELGLAKEHWNDLRGALNEYRAIDLMHPGSPPAERARQRIAALQSQGQVVRNYSIVQRMARASRLVDSGPFELAREEIGQLLSASLSRRAELDLLELAVRLARRDGGSNESHALLVRAQAALGSASAPSSSRTLTKPAPDPKAEALARIERILRRRSYARLSLLQLKGVMTIAAQAALKTPAEDVLNAILKSRHRVLPGFRFDVAMLAAGVVGDDLLIEALSPLLTDGTYGIGARYHYARALERLGKLEEAQAAFRDLVQTDKGTLPYYRMWSKLRLGQLQEGTSRSGAHTSIRSQTAPWLSNASFYVPPPPRKETSPTLKQLGPGLRDIAGVYSDAYPWLKRAWILVALGQYSEASDELHETYLAWRAATGRTTPRAGLASVYKGRAIRMPLPSPKVRHQRRELSLRERQKIANVCVALGDFGTAIGLAGWQSLAGLPRPHQEAVRAIAKEQGLDPNLLLAVMRVESVYQKRIVSYAGAMGLMQIMPRTGALIAQKMGQEDFVSTDLLDPNTNIRFAAWYLASLLRRFDGVLPLAIAAYNGGPHNVRKWLALYPDSMPLDVFLEHIPFEQTHRYVRRVLTHYAQYRAEQGLPMVTLVTALPKMQMDNVAF